MLITLAVNLILQLKPPQHLCLSQLVQSTSEVDNFPITKIIKSGNAAGKLF